MANSNDANANARNLMFSACMIDMWLHTLYRLRFVRKFFNCNLLV
jgi:hypothetical protein